jgi:hypothetical protein
MSCIFTIRYTLFSLVECNAPPEGGHIQKGGKTIPSEYSTNTLFLGRSQVTKKSVTNAEITTTYFRQDSSSPDGDCGA